MFSSEAWLSNSSGFYNGVATTSMRTDAVTTKNVSRTPSSESNKRTFTFSTWFKRSHLDYTSSETVHQIFSAQVDGNDYFAIYFQDDFTLTVQDYHTSEGMILIPSRLFRDVSAWYHLVVAIDTTQATDTNRVKIYVNGVQETSFATATYPTQNYDTYINDDVKHTLGSSFDNSSQAFGGYFAETNLVDGTQLAPTSFGEFKNGVWIPIKYTGSYGTNGFRLQFNQTGVGTASTSTIGADTSGNTNHFTSSGIVASDCNMPDSPENNFCTMNSTDLQYNAELLNGNLHIKATTYSGGNYGHAICTFNIPSSGKWYIEILGKNLAGTGNASAFGVMDRNVVQLPSNKASPNYVVTTDEGFDGLQHQHSTSGEYVAVKVDGATSGSTMSMSTSGDTGSVSALAIDVDNGYLYVGATDGVGGTGSQIRWLDYADGSTGTSNVNPESGSSGTGGIARTFTNNDVISVETTVNGSNTNKSQIYLNAGQDSSFGGTLTAQGNTDTNGIGDFYYVVPSGYLALCTSNLSDSDLPISPNALTQADDHFNTVLYSGNGSGQSITGVGFQPDWVWAKERSSGSSHQWYDSSRGVTNRLESDNTGDEDVIDGVTSFDTDGFTIGTHSAINDNGITNVAWNWKANGGTTSSNTDGSITSTVQANTTAGFSIVTYTGTGANATVGHGVQVNNVATAPRMIIMKRRDSDQNWVVYHEEIGNDRELLLNVGNQQTNSSSTFFQNTSPTTSVFSLGSDNYANASSGTYVAYCFADVEGYSKIGKYNPNNTTDSAFVHTGFKPAMVILKGAEINNQEWCILDNKRPSYNPVYNLNPNEPAIETTSNHVDFVSNGFKIRATGGVGYLTSTYIYIAFAEVPFKYAVGG